MVKSITTFKALLSAFLLFAAVGLFAQTFTGPGASIGTSSGPFSVYPSTVNVTGVGTAYSGFSVSINGLTHTFPSDLDFLLVGPTGAMCVLMSDVGSSFDISGVTYTFDDAGPAMSTSAANPTGTYRPTNSGTPDTWSAPGPGSVSQATPTLSVFNGLNANGTWSLYAYDDVGGDAGDFVSWSISFIPPVTNDVCGGAISISCGYSGSGSTVGATVDAVPSCGGIAASYPGVWYKFTPTPANGMFLNLSTCGQGNLNTKISVYTGSCGNLVCLGSNDDGAGCANGTSSMTFRPIWNRTHYVLVQSTTTGAFGLTLTCNVTPSFGLAQDVQDDVVSTGKFSVYPNPTQGNLNVGLEPFIGQNAIMTVQNGLGQVVFQRDLGEVQAPTQEVNLDNLQSGMYYMTVRTDEGNFTEKFMVNKNRP
ncbi:MAG: T9SS type A sorting domain-containing protein [Phaeodactylibacter sp.]|nr:T9SS type A sorting domain-containing protein [Phaeodactylibacter sp.]